MEDFATFEEFVKKYKIKYQGYTSDLEYNGSLVLRANDVKEYLETVFKNKIIDEFVDSLTWNETYSGVLRYLYENQLNVQVEKFKNKERLKIGDIVRSFKREIFDEKDYKEFEKNFYLYKIIGIAEDTQKEKTMIVYEALFTDIPAKIYKGKIFTETLSSFISKVDKEEYPNVRQTYKYEKVSTEVK